jgi:adenosylcobyric acid synthase
MTRLAPTLMIQGTASNVGKSLIATAFCRLFRSAGLRVAPFKAQNMALNAAVTQDGHEIGRAQAAQAEACGVEATFHMNPILLKPEGERRSQVIVNGRSIGSMGAVEYHKVKPELRGMIAESLTYLRSTYDLVVIEGAGSPAEINLKQHDLVNMFVARTAQSPVMLVGDIDRGGVFASFVGTMELLDPEERSLVRGFIVNKFRGDVSLLTSGLDFLHQRTGVPVLGVLPYVRDHQLPEEDSLGLEDRRRIKQRTGDKIGIAVIRLPRMSNYDEFQPLEREPSVSLNFVDQAALLDDADLVILPGTKNTLDDLAWLKQSGLASALVRRAESGGLILGICGGCQMLGGMIDDTIGVEGEGRVGHGLGLLPFVTVFQHEKRTAQTKVRVSIDTWLAGSKQAEYTGYEIHCGRPQMANDALKTHVGLFAIEERNGVRDHGFDGAMSPNGAVVGTMLHGLLEDPVMRQHLVGELQRRRGGLPSLAGNETNPGSISRDQVYDRLADVLRENLDLKQLETIVFGAHEKMAHMFRNASGMETKR